MEVFITVSPPLRSIRDQSSIYQDDLLYLAKVRLCSKHYVIYPEFDSSGRLHYHGIMRIDDKIKWYKSVLPMLRKCLGFVCIKQINTIKDKINIILYITKDWSVTKEILYLEVPIMPSKRKREIKVESSQLDEGITKWYYITNGRRP